MEKGHNKLIKLGISGVLILGCCSLIFIDLYVQCNLVLFIGNSLIVIIGMIYLLIFLKRYFRNQYLDGCQLSPLAAEYNAHSIEYHKCGVRKGKELGIVFLFFLTAIIVLNFVIFNPKGNSVATAYSNYYRIDINNIHILQQENLGQKEFAIIYDGSEIAYCIFDKTERNDSDSYVIKKVYKLFKDVKNQKKELSDLNIYNERINFYQNSSAEAEIETIVIDFYIKEGILSDNSNQCKGYSLYPYISNITVKGGNLSVTPVKVASDCLYMWTLSDVNIGELDYFDFSCY